MGFKNKVTGQNLKFGQWTDWYHSPDYFGCMVKDMIEEGWTGKVLHRLIAPNEEPDKRNNHVHIKCRTKLKNGSYTETGWVLCRVKGDSVDINRGTFISTINGATGLRLPIVW